MKPIAKYNTFKGISTVLTVGTPIITLACCSDMFVHRSETAISAAGMFGLLLAALLLKDKIAENFKAPSAFIISAIGIIFVAMMKNILEPIEYMCWATLITSGVDEITFKQFYKVLEAQFPESIQVYKKFGFIFGKSDNLIGGTENEAKQ
nr:MAG TPA: hypothetical protein [Caudoviricetes sp.]